MSKKTDKIVQSFFAPLLNPGDKLYQMREGTIVKKGTLYFDWTASGLAHKLIEKRVQKLLPYYANTHSDVSSHARLMSKIYQKSKQTLCESLELDDSFALLSCGFGASGAIKKFQEILGVYLPSKTRQILGDKLKNISLPSVFVGPYEHHSNEISWREGLCEVSRIPLDSSGLFDLKVLEKSLQLAKKPFVGSFSVASNVTGTLSPYHEIAEIAGKYGLIKAFDMASSSAYMNISSKIFDACFLSPHKLLGGIGSNGILCIKKNLISTDIPPSFSGGGVIKYANRTTQEYFNDPEIREEAGTHGLLQMYRTALAYALRNEFGLETIRRRENILYQILLYELSAIPTLEIYGNLKASRISVVSFNVMGISPYDLAYILSEIYGIQTRAGCSCAGPYGHDLLGMEDISFEELGHKPGWLRVSLHYTHSLEDIEYFIECLKKSIKRLR